jgi:hypothetical protein
MKHSLHPVSVIVAPVALGPVSGFGMIRTALAWRHKGPGDAFTG